MFLGEYKYALDLKGRLALPPKFRQNLKSGAIVTRGLDQSLFVFPAAEWHALADKLINLPLTNSNSRAFVRLMLSGAMDVSFDKQGRILIPDYLRDYAVLKKDVVVIGLYNRLEIWSEANWRFYQRRTERRAGDIAEQMGELGI